MQQTPNASTVPLFSSTRAAHLFTACALLVIAFQLALVSGAPWGALTQGGRVVGVLPGSGRAVAGVSAVLLVAMTLIVRARAGLPAGRWAARLGRLAWFVVGYCVLGVLAHIATPSAPERMPWLPVVSIMLIASLRVVRGAQRSSASGAA